MSDIVIYDKATGAVKSHLFSVNTPDYQGRDDVLINPDVTIFQTVPLFYTKVSGGVIVEMTAAEKADVDAAAAAVEKDLTPKEIKDELKNIKKRLDDLENI